MDGCLDVLGTSALTTLALAAVVAVATAALLCHACHDRQALLEEGARHAEFNAEQRRKQPQV